MITQRLLDEFEIYAKEKAEQIINQVDRLFQGGRAPLELPDMPDETAQESEMNYAQK